MLLLKNIMQHARFDLLEHVHFAKYIFTYISDQGEMKVHFSKNIQLRAGILRAYHWECLKR